MDVSACLVTVTIKLVYEENDEIIYREVVAFVGSDTTAELRSRRISYR